MMDVVIGKPAATSAASTAFCAAKVEGPGGFLWIDGNGKITAGNGTLEEPKPNAFSLVQIDDCPGSTPTCRHSCYVHNLEKFAPETHALYRHNSQAIRSFVSEARDTWAKIMAAWIIENCRGGFRWHVSGDIFDIGYARWIVDVCRQSIDVGHWIYTRSLDYLQPLAGISTINAGNLAVNLSCDADNYERAKDKADIYGFRLCYMTSDGVIPDDLPDGSIIFPDYALRGGNQMGMDWFDGLTPQYKSFVCPVDFHGKSEQRRCGPCVRCLR